MILKILALYVEGKAFVEDVERRTIYYMNQRGDELRPAEDEDFYPMNMQGVFLESEDYKEKQFKTLDEAQKFISNASINCLIKAVENLPENATPKMKHAAQQLLKIYREELKMYI